MAKPTAPEYRVAEDVSVETHDALLGHVEESFKAGAVRPKSEAQEAALEMLVANGQAELVKPAEEKET